ncbi:hypothetical protein HDU93_002987 [Gonapodya sp. JEL0774]|nr:hypothetical protein HDU93_002987 [Gonapodya sp. JEL0774]
MQVEMRVRPQRPATPSETIRESGRTPSPPPRAKSRLLPANLIHSRKPSPPPLHASADPERSRWRPDVSTQPRSPPLQSHEIPERRSGLLERPRVHRSSTEGPKTRTKSFGGERGSSFFAPDSPKSPTGLFANSKVGSEPRTQETRSVLRAERERRVDSGFTAESSNEYKEYSEGVAEHLSKLDELSNRIRKTLDDVDLEALSAAPNSRDSDNDSVNVSSDEEIEAIHIKSPLSRSYRDVLARSTPRGVAWPWRRDARSRTYSEGGSFKVASVTHKAEVEAEALGGNAFSRLDFLTKQIRSTLEEGSKIITTNELQVSRLERDQHYAEVLRLRDENRILMDRLHYFREVEMELVKAKERIRKLESDVTREVNSRTDDVKHEVANLRRELDILRRQREEDALVRKVLEEENEILKKHREDMALKNNELFHSRLKLRSELAKTQKSLEEREQELLVVRSELESERLRAKALEEELEEERQKGETRDTWKSSMR